MASHHLRNLEDVKSMLEAIGWRGVSYLNSRDYEAVRRLLKKAGIDIRTDEFDIVPLPMTRGRAKKKIPLMRKRLKK